MQFFKNLNIGNRVWNSGTIMSWGNLGLRTGSMLLLLPMVLLHLPPQDVAVFYLLSSSVALAMIGGQVLSTNFTRFVAYVVSGCRKEDLVSWNPTTKPLMREGREIDISTLGVLLTTMRWAYFAVSLLAFFLLLGIGSLALTEPIGKAAEPSRAWLAYFLVTCGCIASLQISRYASILRGMDCVATEQRCAGFFSFVSSGAMIVTLYLGGDLLALVATQQSVLLLHILILWGMVKRVLPDAKSSFSGVFSPPDMGIWSSIWPSTWRSALGVVFSVGVIHLSGIYYAQYFSGVQLASYMLGLRLMQVISQFAQVPFYSKMPRMSALWARGARIEIAKVAKHNMLMSHWCYVIPVLLCTLLGDTLVRLIGSETPFPDPNVWLLLVAGNLAVRYGAMHIQLYSLSNHILWHIANGVSGTIAIALTLFLLPQVGLAAFPLALLISSVGFYSPYSAHLGWKMIDENPLRFELVVFVPAVLTFILGVLLIHFNGF